MLQTLAIAMPGPFELMIIAGVALMIFGKRLPSVGRNVALGIRGFQQGLKDPGTDQDDAVRSLPDKQ
jgi:sec-independent protein translocase protein TatA